jgi:RNA ligase (TIGR02306 family)
MPSNLVVEVCRIGRVSPHPNADRLELAIIKGWQAVVPKGKMQEGQLIVYFPPDTVLPKEVTDKFGVTSYTAACRQGQRIRQAKLRGEPSFGLVVPPDDPSWPVGKDVAAHYQAVKYDPPLKVSAGDAETPHPMFVSYTEIENMRNYPDVFADGEEVVATEKIHGGNSRIAVIEGEPMAGSHGLRRKRPETIAPGDLYWFPWTLEAVRNLLNDIAKASRQAILFGEVYGRVQSLHYGLENGIGFRAFDLLVDGKYADYELFKRSCDLFGVETAPVIYRGPFSLAKIREVSGGRSTIPGADNIREGVVVRPLREKTDPKIGRVVLKYVSDEYLTGKHSDEEVADR